VVKVVSSWISIFPHVAIAFTMSIQQNIVYVMLFHVQFGNLVFYQGGMREQMEAQMYRKQAFTIDFANFFNVQ
jgi:hypothetical protein